MGIKLRMTISCRTQADGQVERQNCTLKDAPRCMVSLHGTDWVDVLGTVEFAHLTLVSSSTKMSPFEIDTSRVARMPIGATTTRNEYTINAKKITVVLWLKRSKIWQRPKIDSAHSDVVILATSNLPLEHATTGTSFQKDEFAPNVVGPFKTIKMVNNKVA
ncbi:Retroelement [Phytophthora megakarya]|uniref:Retroelement n=1 Tax=Phytophthora megakarya TaxID=4795 RepID=A0A225WE61_9STRA|nr:Retroelement [Phytophthora megakarya]